MECYQVFLKPKGWYLAASVPKHEWRGNFFVFVGKTKTIVIINASVHVRTLSRAEALNIASFIASGSGRRFGIDMSCI